MVLDVEVYPEMPRKESKAVPEGNGPIPQDAYVMLSGITLEDLRRTMSEAAGKVFDKHFGQNPENPEEIKAKEQRSANHEQDARESRLAMEADVTRYAETHKRMEDAGANKSSEE